MITGATPNDDRSSKGREEASLELASLQSAVKELEPLCQPPNELVEQFVLRFSDDEYDLVNEVWEESGIDSVMDRWGEERRMSLRSVEGEEASMGGDLFSNLIHLQQGSSIRLLHVARFEPVDISTAVPGLNYRTALLDLAGDEEIRLLQELHDSGVAAAVVPAQDSQQGVKLSVDDIVGLNVSAHWHGSGNWEGAGCEFKMMLEMSCDSADRIFVAVAVDEQGLITSELYVPDRFETGYDQRMIELQPAQLTVLIDIIRSSAAGGGEPGSTDYLGHWIGGNAQ